MRPSDIDGQIEYVLEAFCRGYGYPVGSSSTLEVSHDTATYVYADIVGTVRAGKVIFELNSEDLVCKRKALWAVDNPVPPLPTRGGQPCQMQIIA